MAISLSELPTISIVIPTLNQGAYLEECLRSVVDQGYPNTELIVIDGGSTDNTVEILRAFEQHIAYWTSEPDRGQSHALNKGFAVTTGEIVSWQNSDDYYLPNAFRSIARAFNRRPDAAVVYGDWLEVDAQGKIAIHWYASKFSLMSAKYGGTNAIAQAMFWRQEVHVRFGEFPEELHQVMDHYLTFRIGMNEGFERFVRIDAELMAFRRHDDQKTGNLERSRVAQELTTMDALLEIHRLGGPAGAMLRLSYRTLRAYRYLRRGGIRYLLNRMSDDKPT